MDRARWDREAAQMDGVMADEHSITHWLGELREGNSEAAQQLWERYFTQLLTVARGKMRGLARQAADEEDVVLSAFQSFCQAAARNRFPRLDSRDDLWRVLVMLTARKAFQERRRQYALKRGGKVNEEAHRQVSVSVSTEGLAEIIGREPDPSFTVLLADQFNTLLRNLPDNELRQIARWRLEEYSSAEIAERLGYSERTVARKVALIRRFWEDSDPEV